jgi:hypothetical protein
MTSIALRLEQVICIQTYVYILMHPVIAQILDQGMLFYMYKAIGRTGHPIMRG